MEEQEVPTEHLHEHTEHAAQHSGERWTLGVALSSALLAALAAVASLQAGHHANEAMVCQIKASDNWSFYQAKSIKESQLKGKMDIFVALDKPVNEADKKKAEEYATTKETISEEAKKLQEEAGHELTTHQIFAKSVTLFQIAISIGAIAALTKRRRFWFVSLACGAVGLFFFVQAFLFAAGHCR